MTREQFVRELATGTTPCTMKECPEIATHAIVVEAHGDNTTFALACCEPHYKFLLAELSKRPDHLYTKYVTGADLVEEKVQ